jgi:hypothetical protein
MAGAGLITVAVCLLIGVLGVVFGLLRFVLQAMGIFLRPGQRLDPFELNRRRATGAAFVGTLCVYLLQAGGSLLEELPPWVPVALLVLVGVSLLLALAGLAGARGAPRDLSGVVVSLVVAAGGYALLRRQWHLPTDYGAVSEFLDDWPVVAGFFNTAVRDLNELLPGIYIAMVVAGLARAVICLQVFGGQQQRDPFEIARARTVTAAFALVAALYLLFTGQWLGPLLGAPGAWVPTALMAIAGLSLVLLVSGLYTVQKIGLRDPHGVGVSLVAAAAALSALWGRWQVPPGPATEYVNRLLPGLYVAVLIAALMRALLCARLLGGAWRIIERLRQQRATGMRPASASGFWAEMRASFERGRARRS